MLKKNKKLTIGTIMDAVHQKVFKESGIKGKAKAGKAGAYFEATVSSLGRIGYPLIPFKNKKNYNTLPGCYIETNVPYCNILCQVAKKYDLKKRSRRGRTEFVIVSNRAVSTPEFSNVGNKTEDRFRVECKWQNVPGTCQNKLTHSILDLLYGAPEENIILLLDGDGFDPVMKRFIYDICENNGLDWKNSYPQQRCNKRMKMMGMEEFIDWVNRALI